jgi:YYY domain-containing protein
VLSFLRWYLVVQCLGLIGFALARSWCGRLPDRGYTLGKSLGVVLCGTTLWFGTACGLLLNGAGGATLALLALAAAVVAVWWKAWRRGDATLTMLRFLPHPGVLVAAELVFLVAFAGWSVVRAFDPAANHTEQPMDLMFLTATSASATFPPVDPWLAGFPISYYYLGYWLVGTLGHLAGLAPEVAYNLGQACWFGLLVVGCFGLGFNLARLANPEAKGLRGALTAGGLTAVAVAGTSNLRFVVDWLARRSGGGAEAANDTGWWWWKSSRVVEDVDLSGNAIEIITEFPFFSYLLGDNHPHLLSMPFVVLCVMLALNIFLNATSRDDRSLSRGWSHRGPLGAFPGGSLGLVLTIVICGALIPLNTWDYPIGLFLVVIAAVFPTRSIERGPSGPVFRAAALGALLVVGAVAIYFPYFLTAQSQAAGLIPNLFHPTSVGQLALVFGTFAPGLLLLLYVAWSETPPRPAHVATIFSTLLTAAAVWLLVAALWAGQSLAGAAWIDQVARGEAIANPLGVALRRWLVGWPTLGIAIACLAVIMAVLWRRRRLPESRRFGSTFVLLLAGSGVLLVLVPELVYLRTIWLGCFSESPVASASHRAAGAGGRRGSWPRSRCCSSPRV